MDGWMDGWMDGRTGGRADGRMVDGLTQTRIKVQRLRQKRNRRKHLDHNDSNNHRPILLHIRDTVLPRGGCPSPQAFSNRSSSSSSSSSSSKLLLSLLS
jgi:hypothetical protein